MYDATDYNADVKVEELKDSGVLDFNVCRSSAGIHVVKCPKIKAINGHFRIHVDPEELITLRSLRS